MKNILTDYPVNTFLSITIATRQHTCLQKIKYGWN